MSLRDWIIHTRRASRNDNSRTRTHIYTSSCLSSCERKVKYGEAASHGGGATVKCRIVGERVQQPETDEHPRSNSDKQTPAWPEIWDCDSFRNYWTSSIHHSDPLAVDVIQAGEDETQEAHHAREGKRKTTFGINSLHFLPLWLSSSLFSSFDRMPAIRAGGCVPSSVFIRPENTAVGAKWDYLADTGRTTGHFTKEFPYAWLCYCSSRGLAQSQKPFCLILVFMVSASNCLPCWHFAPLRWLLLLSRPVNHLLA